MIRMHVTGLGWIEAVDEQDLIRIVKEQHGWSDQQIGFLLHALHDADELKRKQYEDDARSRRN